MYLFNYQIENLTQILRRLSEGDAGIGTTSGKYLGKTANYLAVL
jgi:hypothetical protein